jgi:hypothetical protein
MNLVKDKEELSEKEYWRQHINSCNERNQKKSTYCREHQLDYNKMMYWQKKIKEDTVSFIPVEMKKDQLISSGNCICTLTLASGYMLSIYDERALTIILDKWK